MELQNACHLHSAFKGEKNISSPLQKKKYIYISSHIVVMAHDALIQIKSALSSQQ